MNFELIKKGLKKHDLARVYIIFVKNVTLLSKINLLKLDKNNTDFTLNKTRRGREKKRVCLLNT